jgi:hypothetical protein
MVEKNSYGSKLAKIFVPLLAAAAFTGCKSADGYFVKSKNCEDADWKNYVTLESKALETEKTGFERLGADSKATV